MSLEIVFRPPCYYRQLRKSDLFPDAEKPLEVDLGCGDGEFLVEMCALYPERNFLGVERLAGRVEKTAKRLKNRGLTNGRVIRLESIYTVNWMLPEASISRLHLLCPDPWPKKRHERRRLVNDPEFLHALIKILESGGEFLLKTDDAVYHENALASFSEDAELVEHFARQEWPDEAFPYPLTGFEQQWLSVNRSINRARWKKVG